MANVPITLSHSTKALNHEPLERQKQGDGHGHDRWVEGHYLGDPYATPRCPNCGTLYPETYVDGIGQQAVRCVKCNTPVTPFQMVNGYTVVFDETRQVGITVPKEAAERIAHSANRFAALPAGSAQSRFDATLPSLPGLTRDSTSV